MASQYTNVTASDMDAFLSVQGFKRLTIEGTKEIVYGKGFKVRQTSASVRIYTGIEGETGQSRDKGKDAIRVAIYIRDANGNPVGIGKTTIVKRVLGWAANLQKRLESLESLLGPWCPKCDGFTVKRKGQYGEFYGCCNHRATGCKGLVVTEDCKKADPNKPVKPKTYKQFRPGPYTGPRKGVPMRRSF